MLGVSNSYLAALADLFYPQYCVGCEQRAGDVLCRGCFDALPTIELPVCARCGMPTAFETFACEECKNVDFGFEGARAALRYEGVGKEIVHSLKYKGYTAVPVPLHRSRQRRRGFNQAVLLGRGVAGRLGVPVSDTLEAVRRTRDQVELSAGERRANVEGAYTARARVRGTILLVDDVFTTGATMNSCARALTRAGADEVYALSLCRTV
jgi:competence protein ComFC